MRTIVETRHIKHCCNIVIDYSSRLVHTHGYWSCRILPVADLLKPKSNLSTLVAWPLVRNLVTDTPHHDSRAVPVMSDKIDEVLFCPLLEIEVIAVLHLRSYPTVEGLGHEHHTHLVTNLDKFWSRHIVGCSDGVATHILKHTDLSADTGFIGYRTERTEIMVVAYTLEYSLLTVKEESLIRSKFNCTYTESCLNFVNESFTLIYLADQCV